MNEPFITVDNLTKSYTRGKESVVVIDDLDLEIEAEEFLALMGPSGSGKSTLLNLLGGLDRADSGHIRIAGISLWTLSERALTEWRSHAVGFIFQFYNLLPVLSARRNVELPLLLTNLSRRQRRHRAETALEIVGLADRAEHKPGELSGGQQQRVAIARALVADPALLLCDEPTGDLDRKTADEILDLLGLLNREYGKTVVMVTHDPQAASHAVRCIHLDKGRLVLVDIAT